MIWDFLRYPRSAAGWVVRLSTGHVDARTRLAFRRWLSGDPARRGDFRLHAATWRLASTLSAAAAERASGNISSSSQRSVRWVWPAAAAAGAVAMLAWLQAPMLLRGLERSHFQTGAGQTRRVALSDGSVVYLDTDTDVQIETTASYRQVLLSRGEAFFEVVHDPARPLEVVAGAHVVTDVGTQFVVRTLDEGVEVAVAQGVVVVGEAKDDAPIPSAAATRLSAGYQYVQTDARTPARVQRVDIAQIASWRAGRLVLNQTTVGDIVDEVNRYSARKLIIEDPDIRKLKLGGTFARDDSATVAVALHDIYGLRLRDVGDTIQISR